MKALLKSKKFLMAILGVAVAIAARFGLNLDTAALYAVVSPIIAYIIGQGLADTGKEKAMIENGGRLAVADKLLDAAGKEKEDA